MYVFHWGPVRGLVNVLVPLGAVRGLVNVRVPLGARQRVG